MNEPFTVRSNGETWTRNTRNGAVGLADNIARCRYETATVEHTGDGMIFYWAFGAREGAD